VLVLVGCETSTKAPNSGAGESAFGLPCAVVDGTADTESERVAASVVEIDSAVVVATEWGL